LFTDGNAHLDVSRLDIETPENMSDEKKQYLSDICSIALYAIGDNILINTESRTVPPTSTPFVIDVTSSPSSSGQEETQSHRLLLVLTKVVILRLDNNQRLLPPIKSPQAQLYQVLRRPRLYPK